MIILGDETVRCFAPCLPGPALSVHQRALAAWRSLPQEVQLQWNALVWNVEPHRPPFDHSTRISGSIYLSVPTTVSPRSEMSKFRSRGPLRSFLHSLLRWVERLWLRVCWYYRFRCLLLLRLSLSAIGCWPRSSSRSQARGATRVRCAMSWRIAHVDLRQSISSLIRASGASTCSITRCMPGSSCSIRSQATEASIISSRF